MPFAKARPCVEPPCFRDAASTIRNVDAIKPEFLPTFSDGGLKVEGGLLRSSRRSSREKFERQEKKKEFLPPLSATWKKCRCETGGDLACTCTSRLRSRPTLMVDHPGQIFREKLNTSIIARAFATFKSSPLFFPYFFSFFSKSGPLSPPRLSPFLPFLRNPSIFTRFAGAFPFRRRCGVASGRFDERSRFVAVATGRFRRAAPFRRRCVGTVRDAAPFRRRCVGTVPSSVLAFPPLRRDGSRRGAVSTSLRRDASRRVAVSSPLRRNGSVERSRVPGVATGRFVERSRVDGTVSLCRRFAGTLRRSRAAPL